MFTSRTTTRKRSVQYRIRSNPSTKLDIQNELECLARSTRTRGESHVVFLSAHQFPTLIASPRAQPFPTWNTRRGLCEPVRVFSCAIQPFFHRNPNHSTHCQAIHDLSVSRTGAWNPYVSPKFQVRIVLVMTRCPTFSSNRRYHRLQHRFAFDLPSI